MIAFAALAGCAGGGPSYDPDSPEGRAFRDVQSEWGNQRFVDELILDAALMVWPLVFGALLWLGVRRLPLRVAFGASFYLFAALVLSYELVHIVASTVVVLVVAELLAFVAWLIVFEAWVFGVLPEYLELPESRTALVGNGAMLLIQIVSLALERLVVRG